MELEEEFVKTLSKSQLQDLILNIVEQLKIENKILRKKVEMLEDLQNLTEENQESDKNGYEKITQGMQKNWSKYGN